MGTHQKLSAGLRHQPHPPSRNNHNCLIQASYHTSCSSSVAAIAALSSRNQKRLHISSGSMVTSHPMAGMVHFGMWSSPSFENPIWGENLPLHLSPVLRVFWELVSVVLGFVSFSLLLFVLLFQLSFLPSLCARVLDTVSVILRLAPAVPSYMTCDASFLFEVLMKLHSSCQSWCLLLVSPASTLHAASSHHFATSINWSKFG